ncbi:zinc ribbon domain-containing protein [Streptomyces collinus]|uniref:zinc ribbon domain-containing protein n=1 Tax=Streptomyces collinus TaxID=42684 RepID=UPI0033FA74D9
MTDGIRCSNCGTVIAPATAFCPECGHRQNAATDSVTTLGAPSNQPAPPPPPHAPLPVPNSSEIYAEYDSRKLTVLTGYAAALIGGLFIGLHRIYAGKPLWWLYLVLFILGSILSIVLVGFVFWGAAFIWLLVDLAMMPGWIEERNRQIRQAVFGR